MAASTITKYSQSGVPSLEDGASDDGGAAVDVFPHTAATQGVMKPSVPPDHALPAASTTAPAGISNRYIDCGKSVCDTVTRTSTAPVTEFQTFVDTCMLRKSMLATFTLPLAATSVSVAAGGAGAILTSSLKASLNCGCTLDAMPPSGGSEVWSVGGITSATQYV